MKTFLGFTTGMMTGAFIGAVGVISLVLSSQYIRDFYDKIGDDSFDKFIGIEES